ncbi:MAG: hypothetical protein IRZ09_11790 [Variibacter sp.]|nr:hypothetical protein [Variibacter sp.]
MTSLQPAGSSNPVALARRETADGITVPTPAAIAHAPSRLGDRAVAGVLAAALLLLPAFWNGFPLLQYDTGGYLARWYEGTLVPSRPGAYGLVLAAAGRFDFWPAVFAQAALTVWVLALVLRTQGLRPRPALLLGLVALLSLVTTLPWLASLLLTDIFAGLAVLALHLVVLRGEALSRAERAALVALIAAAAATHSATFAVLAALMLAAVIGACISRVRLPRAGLARGLGGVALGVALTLAANFAVSGRIAWTPGGIALSFGRMLQDGIVHRYLDDHCPDPRLLLCMYRRELPRDADEWFWGSDLFDSLGRFAGLGEEMETIALGSLKAYPWLQARTAAVATARQFARVASGEGVVDRIWHTYAIVERFTPWAAPAMRAARQQAGGLAFTWINRVHVPVALGATMLLPALIVLGRRRARLAPCGELAATVALALLANAFVCGVLSNPHDRYGARMAWLAVLAVGVGASITMQRERAAGPGQLLP